MTAAFIAGLAVGCGLATVVWTWDREILRERLRISESRHDAYRLSDTRTDLDLVGPITPASGTASHIYDFEQEVELVCSSCGGPLAEGDDPDWCSACEADDRRRRKMEESQAAWNSGAAEGLWRYT